MAQEPKIERQAEELDRLLTSLIQRYQFRDRNSICCGSITVSQCYVMKELGRDGPLTMTTLAGRMRLAVSTLTRVVGQLERAGLVASRHPAGDRRVRQVALTPAGTATLQSMERRIRQSERAVLEKLAPADRMGLIRGLRRLTQALDERDTESCERRNGDERAPVARGR